MFKFWGKVRRHNKRGKALGFPTANVDLHKKIPEGVYISKTRIAGKVLQSLTFIGKAKTFNEQKFQAEIYILDFNENIYSRWISVGLLKKIRGNRKFNSAKELIRQMREDERVAKRFFINWTKI